MVNLRTLFCHTSQIAQADAQESEIEEEDCASRRIRKVCVHDLSLISEANVPDLVSPVAICVSAQDKVEQFVSDVRLGKIFSISHVVQVVKFSNFTPYRRSGSRGGALGPVPPPFWEKS